jgi:flagellar motor protein MotB
MAVNKKQEEAEGTPAWIVSFADMITLLLAFFVLLQSFAKEQDPELFQQGQGAFCRSISGFGIPDLLFGKPQHISGLMNKKRHPTEESKDSKINRQRVIDIRDAKIRQAFERIKEAIDTKTSKKVPDPTNIMSTPIRFEPGSAVLDTAARKYLVDLAGELGRNLNPKRVRFVIIASAPDYPEGKSRWTLSTVRSQAVSEYIKSVLAGVSEQQWTLIPMGNGTSAPQDPNQTTTTREEFVRIVIMGAE